MSFCELEHIVFLVWLPILKRDWVFLPSWLSIQQAHQMSKTLYRDFTLTAQKQQNKIIKTVRMNRSYFWNTSNVHVFEFGENCLENCIWTQFCFGKYCYKNEKKILPSSSSSSSSSASPKQQPLLYCTIKEQHNDTSSSFKSHINMYQGHISRLFYIKTLQ